MHTDESQIYIAHAKGIKITTAFHLNFQWQRTGENILGESAR